MRRRLPASALFVCSLLLIAPATASASIINFSSLLSGGTPVSLGGYGDARSYGTSLSLGGLTFTTTNNIANGLIAWETTNANHPTGGAPATSLTEWAAGFQITFTRTGGGTFELNGIDLANWGTIAGAWPLTFDVNFVGTRADSSTVSQTFTVTNPTFAAPTPALQTFAFSGFTNLVNVKVTQGVYGSGTAFQFNNVNVGPADTTTAAPEPATLLLFGGGTALMAGLRRFRFHLLDR